MELATLQDLFVEELKDLYNAETQATGALPKMADAACAPELKNAFNTHLQQTRQHISRLEQIFQQLDESPGGKKCKGMAGLIAECEDLISEDADPDVLDAGLIACAQRVEHYEIAVYGTVRTYAQHMGRNDWAELLQQTLNEEGDTDHMLNQLAVSRVNPQSQQQAA